MSHAAIALDIKTSKLRVESWGYATQLYPYADSQRYDTVTDTRHPHTFGPVSLKHGLIAHLDMEKLAAGQACWTLIHVDLEVGRRANLAVAEAIAIDKLDAFTMSALTTTVDATEPAEPATDAERMTKLKLRWSELCEADRQRFASLNVDMADADAVEAAIDAVDPMRQPPPPPVPAVIPEQEPDIPKLSATDDEGATLNDIEAATVRRAYAGLTPNQITWLAVVAKAATKGGAGLDMKLHRPTQRRGAIVTALSEIADEYVGDTEESDRFATAVLNGALALVVGENPDKTGHTPGAALATLNAEQADQLAAIVRLVIALTLPLEIDQWGRNNYDETYLP
jgi:hypothetical protein